uniref:DUF4408 domain-containing protein n=1 Tax=Oryza brachyantha TaxID=4533 RepID=J3L3E0_ORYBR
MDGADASTAWPLGWSLLRGYFSPATLFLLLNVVIGTIALTSRSHRRHHDDDERHKAQRQHQHDHYHEPQRRYDDQYAPPPPLPAPLARTSSVMERLRSFGLYRFRSGDFPPEYNLSAAAAANAICDESEKQQAQYTRSRSEPAARPLPPVEHGRGGGHRAPPPRAPARPVQAAAKEEASTAGSPGLATASSVDARADDFINKFREQLQLQRLNSLLNYTEMLNRGADAKSSSVGDPCV